ncbi:MAG: hypothetical protein ACLSUW_01630 [Akkermansia sp.]
MSYVAARLENTKVDEKVILRAYDALSAAHECVVVEGVGGWEVPIGPGRISAIWLRISSCLFFW